MARAKMLAESEIHSLIATVEYDPLLPNSIKQLREDGRLARSVGVINFFSYYAMISCEKNKAGELCNFYVHPERVVVSRRSRYIGLTGLRSSEFLDSEGRIFAREIIGENGQVVSFQLDIEGRVLVNFNTRDDAYVHWLNEISGFAEFCVLIADASTKSGAVSKVSAHNARKVLTLHGNHFAHPFTYGSPITVVSGKIIRHARYADSLVLLTNAQLIDVKKQFLDLTDVRVISNSVNLVSATAGARNPKRFVVVSRLEAVKNIDMIIRAFRLALDVCGDLHLDIWGHGSREEELKKLIEINNLSNHVFLRGYSNTVSTIFAGARCSISASVSEGFGLSILESMSFGCPVISLASNYGPVEIVKNDANGYLVNNEVEMAEKILLLATNEELFSSLSKGGVQTVRDYSPSLIAGKWLNLVRDLISPEWFVNQVKRSNKMRNEYSSVGGNIISASLSIDDLDGYRAVEILRVDRSKKCKDKSCLIEVGLYDIHFVGTDEHKRVIIKLAQGNVVYEGVVPAGAIEFRLSS
ncbi:TPA: glycosyltransferase [Pseudomonas putida]|nr:glycosyltransferase [Pseudomonas putida]